MSTITKARPDQLLIDCFAELLPHWTREQIESSKPMRFAEAYLLLATVHYTTNRAFVLRLKRRGCWQLVTVATRGSFACCKWRSRNRICNVICRSDLDANRYDRSPTHGWGSDIGGQSMPAMVYVANDR